MNEEDGGRRSTGWTKKISEGVPGPTRHLHPVRMQTKEGGGTHDEFPILGPLERDHLATTRPRRDLSTFPRTTVLTTHVDPPVLIPDHVRGVLTRRRVGVSMIVLERVVGIMCRGFRVRVDNRVRFRVEMGLGYAMDQTTITVRVTVRSM